jgi:hypothetical protein
LLIRDWLHLLLAEVLGGGWILAEIKLGADENDRNSGSVVFDLRIPL